MKFCFNKIQKFALVAAVTILSGCASVKESPISGKGAASDTSKESIAFLTLKVANKKNNSYQPNINYAFMKQDREDASDEYAFEVTELMRESENEFKEYLVSFKAEPGQYIITELHGRSGVFPVMGRFAIPFYKSVAIPKNKVVYLGHVDATIVDKTSDDELPAGPFLPLIDQAVVGASSGTFKINIQDAFETDTLYVKEKYPEFRTTRIENMTLSQWQKPVNSSSNGMFPGRF